MDKWHVMTMYSTTVVHVCVAWKKGSICFTVLVHSLNTRIRSSWYTLFRTIPPRIVSYYPGTCYFVLSHHALFRTIPAHVISYYPTTHCFVLSRHMLFRTIPPHIISYSHTTHCFRTCFGGNRCREVLCTMK